MAAFAALVQAPVEMTRAESEPYLVRTTAGLVRGVPRSGGGAKFLGIPYAEPPVGELRWREPVAARSWTGIRDAGKYGASCVQPVLLGNWNRYDAKNGREDCLYLNVVTPVWPAGKRLPVMFWIHGGANLGGSGSGSLYNDGTLPGHGVVLVTINYRLGVFGFLAHPELTRESPHHASGNYGLLDQILALQWVHANIARFGGDPGNITVFGQSAGSADTGMLMTSPLARGLFQKAIAESGAAFAPPVLPLAGAEQFGKESLEGLVDAPAAGNGGAGVWQVSKRDAGILAALRKIPARDLIDRLGDRARQWPGFSPCVDGWVLPRAPAKVFASGREAAIPLMIGTTTREFGVTVPMDELRKLIDSADGDLAPRALAVYGLAGGHTADADPLYGSVAAQWEADSLFHCPVTTEALWHVAAHHAAYEYELDHAIPGQEAQGALHSSDLPYVFGYFPAEGNIGGVFGDTDKKLAGLMETYWTNFAATGNPNVRSSSLGMTMTGRPTGSGLTHWPRLDATQRYLIFAEDGSAQVSKGPLRGEQCELYRQVLAVRMKATN
jgi:para-nitrobenzyl esterase